MTNSRTPSSFAVASNSPEKLDCGAQDRSTCGREAVKSVLRLFDELAKCDTEGILKEVRKAAEGA